MNRFLTIFLSVDSNKIWVHIKFILTLRGKNWLQEIIHDRKLSEVLFCEVEI